MTESTANFATQNEKAKSKLLSQVAQIIRRAGLDYEGWRYIAKQVRKECCLSPAKKGRRMPKVLNTDAFRRVEPGNMRLCLSARASGN